MKPLHIRQLEHAQSLETHIFSTCGINQASQIRATYLPGSQKHEVPLLEFIYANRREIAIAAACGAVAIIMACSTYLLEGGKL